MGGRGGVGILRPLILWPRSTTAASAKSCLSPSLKKPLQLHICKCILAHHFFTAADLNELV